ncbi:hypothetical protein CCHR01_04038 [Colletotrichum chrysophilum]|uniref:Uncharacterized protein n=1 Tax=Colletotrichum chrysophilum TaxID=1836956 RepID=A0AAD9AT48_9PEZI|nr:hypothetical protein CCHR01_04038 [Colletotrichum chrysophilum]
MARHGLLVSLSASLPLQRDIDPSIGERTAPGSKEALPHYATISERPRPGCKLLCFCLTHIRQLSTSMNMSVSPTPFWSRGTNAVSVLDWIGPGTLPFPCPV